jgi:hypothetical protein
VFAQHTQDLEFSPALQRKKRKERKKKTQVRTKMLDNNGKKEVIKVKTFQGSCIIGRRELNAD